MDFKKYYREFFSNDLKAFRQQIPILGNKHYQKDVFKIQYFQLTPNYNYLDFLKNEQAKFAISLFYSVLFDQVAYNISRQYNSFKNVTNYPKFIGNCTSSSETFSSCGQNQPPYSILMALNDFEDKGNIIECDKLPFKNGEKNTPRSIIYYSDIFYQAAIFLKQETKIIFEKNEFEMSWDNFWILADININRKEMQDLLKKY